MNSQNKNCVMRQYITFLTICFLVFMGCTGCTKDKSISPLVGTAWECVEEPEILIFNDNDSGVYYVKSATDGVYDEIYSSFDFTYNVSEKNVYIHIFFSNYDSKYDFVMQDDNTLINGVFHYKKILHKRNQNY